jgi:hypothetical protein
MLIKNEPRSRRDTTGRNGKEPWGVVPMQVALPHAGLSSRNALWP